jgi:phytoene synthase
MFEPRLASDADREICRGAIETGSRSFYAASLLLPLDVRSAAYALYAFCRLSDDLVDVEAGSLDAVERLRARLAAAAARTPVDDPVDRALSDAIFLFDLPVQALEALLEGLEWDACGRRYADFGDLSAYAARVAGSVGALMAALMGARSPELVARACDLGVAMQLTNIARDVGEDARNGRIYLPLEWMMEAGVSVEGFLMAPRFTPELASVVRRLLAAADELYGRADAGIRRLPRGYRPAIFAARLLYAEIGRVVERLGCDSISQRAQVSAARKRALVFEAVWRSAAPAGSHLGGPLAETAFLVDATIRPSRIRPRWWRLDEQAVWVGQLFARLGEESVDRGRAR